MSTFTRNETEALLELSKGLTTVHERLVDTDQNYVLETATVTEDGEPVAELNIVPEDHTFSITNLRA